MDLKGEPWEPLAALTAITVEDFESFYATKVEIVDGYHRYGAIVIFQNNPRALLAPELDIDWEAMALLYPNWIKVDRHKKVICAVPDERSM